MTKFPIPCRPRDHLAAIGRRYPAAWGTVDKLRADRGKAGLPAWPDWCFLPLAGSYAIISSQARVDRLPLGLIGEVPVLGALAAWRVTQGIYRFDPAVYDAVRDTPIDGEIPCEILYRLPEWCVYIETPDMRWHDAILHGVFAHLEWDAATGQRHELRLLLDTESGLIPSVLHLGPWPLREAIDRAYREGVKHIPELSINEQTAMQVMLPEDDDGMAQMTDDAIKTTQPIVSLMLYLCSQAAEIGDGARQPANPTLKLVRGKWRMYQADKPTTWDVGVRMGSALRAAYAAEERGGTHAGPRGHIRRAHWHTIVSGPRLRADGTEIPAANRERKVLWMPPIAVNLTNLGNLPATIHPVR